MNADISHDSKIFATCFIAALAIFMFDLFIPLGVAVGVLYITIVFLSFTTRFPQAAYTTASLTSFLVLLGWALSPFGGEEWKVASNRLLSLLSIWCVAILCTKLRQRGEQQLLHEIQMRESAEAANQAKGAFLTNMSHEIRTPMTAILGFTDILLGNIVNPENIESAGTIKRNGEHLIGLINDILDLSKIDSGKLDVETTACSPHQIVTDVASLMRVQSTAKGLPLKFRFDGPIPEKIQSDPTRLRQILLNIVGNAIKFTENGSIQIVTRLLNEPGQEPKLQFDVIDTGIGIAEEKIEGIFQPFTQADYSTTREFGGTGLGLTISRRLAGLLGGKITVSSIMSSGSTFTVTVPTGPLDDAVMTHNATESAAEPVETKATDEMEAPLDSTRILLAEDGPDNQRLISFVLNRAGADVTVADNGQIGFDLALAARDEGTPFDVVLMDMQMPVLDGYDATGKLREVGYKGPIIALTAHAMSSDRSKCIDAGCDDYATKPINHKKLIELVALYALQREPHQNDVAPVA